MCFCLQREGAIGEDKKKKFDLRKTNPAFMMYQYDSGFFKLILEIYTLILILAKFVIKIHNKYLNLKEEF